MRKLLTALCCILMAALPAVADTYRQSFANMLADCEEQYDTERSNATLETITNQIFTITLSNGTNTGHLQKPRWIFSYSSTNTTRFAFFADNTMTIRLNAPGSITRIILTGASKSYTVGVTASEGTVTKEGETQLVWTGDASELTLTGTGTNGFIEFAMEYTAQLPLSAAPVFTPPAGTYVGPLDVTISATPDATIYYTTNGSAPTTSSPVYDGTPISFPSRWNSDRVPYTVKAIAVEPGSDPSIIVSASYTVLDGVICTSISDFNRRNFEMIPGLGDSQTLYQFTGHYTIAYQNGPLIYLTDNTGGLLVGAPSAPSYRQGDIIDGFSGTFYCAAPFTPQLNCLGGTLGEPAGHEDFTWPVASGAADVCRANMSMPFKLEGVYVDRMKAENPGSFRIARFTDSQEVILYNAFSNVSKFDHAIAFPEHPSYYDVLGFVGSDSGGGDDTSTSNGIVCFFPVEFIPSQVEPASPPVINPAPGEYIEEVTVSILVPAGTEVHYTTDGSAPNADSEIYTEPFTLTRSAKVRAVAIAEGKLPSIIMEADYTVIRTSELPVFTPEAGTYVGEVTVTLSAPDPDAYIHYTLDGTEPDRMSTTYLSPITLSATTTVKAIAISMEQLPSQVVTAVYTITEEQPDDSGISSVSLDRISPDADIFDLQGRRVDASTLRPGVYILTENGRTRRIAVK